MLVQDVSSVAGCFDFLTSSFISILHSFQYLLCENVLLWESLRRLLQTPFPIDSSRESLWFTTVANQGLKHTAF